MIFFVKQKCNFHSFNVKNVLSGSQAAKVAWNSHMSNTWGTKREQKERGRE